MCVAANEARTEDGLTPSWDFVNYRCRRPGFLMRGVFAT
jgi:hypothetical protein